MSDALRAFFSRLRAIFFKTRLDGEFNEELAAHVDLLAAENEKAGMTPEEARRAVVGDVRHLALESQARSFTYRSGKLRTTLRWTLSFAHRWLRAN